MQPKKQQQCFHFKMFKSIATDIGKCLPNIWKKSWVQTFVWVCSLGCWYKFSWTQFDLFGHETIRDRLPWKQSMQKKNSFWKRGCIFYPMTTNQDRLWIRNLYDTHSRKPTNLPFLWHSSSVFNWELPFSQTYASTLQFANHNKDVQRCYIDNAPNNPVQVDKGRTLHNAQS